VAATGDGRIVATGSYDGHIALYDRRTGTWQAPLRPTTSGISSLAYDPGRDRFLASSYDGNVYPVTLR
jgi:WD40 repeat protein